MRRALHPGLVGPCLSLGLLLAAGCDAPASRTPVGAAEVEVAYAQPPLPDAVADTVRRLREISATGSYRDMARLADETAGFRSNTAGMSHQDYWYLMLRTGDRPMAQIERVLAYPYAIAETGEGRVYTWPRMATLRRTQITPAVARDIDRLLGEGHAAAMKAGGPWPGYVLGIAEDGTWLYFISGAG
jgi:hypothetical protein